MQQHQGAIKAPGLSKGLQWAEAVDGSCLFGRKFPISFVFHFSQRQPNILSRSANPDLAPVWSRPSPLFNRAFSKDLRAESSWQTVNWLRS